MFPLTDLPKLVDHRGVRRPRNRKHRVSIGAEHAPEAVSHGLRASVAREAGEALAALLLLVARPRPAIAAVSGARGHRASGALEVLVATAGAGRRVTRPVPGASQLGVLRGTGVHAEGDVEPGHVVCDVAVEVQQHRTGPSNQLGDLDGIFARF